jgi:ribosomal protein S8
MIYLLSDMFSRIKIATGQHFKDMVLLNSKICRSSLIIMKKLGYIIDYYIINFKYLKIYFRYFFGGSVLRISHALWRPNNHHYVKLKNLKNIVHNNSISVGGFFICSTSRFGLLLDVECLLSRNGGALYFFIG